ncbi:MAG TPA: F420-0--gamma-glutamyl ligase [Clostridiaceae bacterium]|nr:F420-0--gamma-glutamyl ligase [Clostridiaceae bacterium]
MRRLTGTTARGIRAPIIREGDDIVSFVVDSVLAAAQAESFTLKDRDVIAITEAIVARAQGNYASVDQIALDFHSKFPAGKVGIVFPILSRNRFATLLKSFARAMDTITLQLSYPTDEVGNALVSVDQLDEKNINSYCEVLTEEYYRQLFGRNPHPFTGVDYIELYHEICREEGCKLTVILANDVREILKYEEGILTCDVHSRKRSKRWLESAGAKQVYNLDDLLTVSVNGSGYNSKFGLLGANKATEEKVKLFPRDCEDCVVAIQKRLRELTGKTIEVMVYGDGAFRDPVGHIWELADPVVSPAFTKGLEGVPHEIKLKYLADNEFATLSGDGLNNAMRESIQERSLSNGNEHICIGTTPRRLTDLLGSLADLTSGSGDKGTPIVLIQGYFDTYADN